MDLRLIIITDRRLAAPRMITDVVGAALEAGAPAIQLRDKMATAADLYRAAVELRSLTRRFGALLFINDRLDVALAAGADGVHLGPDDIPVDAARAAARRARRGDLLIGTSTDDPRRARQAAHDGADYLGCGAVYSTTSKPEVQDEQIGTERLAEVVRATPIPVVGIGGISTANVHAVAATGAAGAAVISAVMTADDVHGVVRTLLEAFL
jgi:thiamine-phosphate pyrophosphorylase